MRAPFDTTCDLIEGPADLNPGMVRAANVDCRLVVEAKIVPQYKPLKLRTFHLTMDSVEPIGFFMHRPGVLNEYIIDTDFGDRVAIPTGGVEAYAVCWVERITPDVGDPYWRAHLIPLPLP